MLWQFIENEWKPRRVPRKGQKKIIIVRGIRLSEAEKEAMFRLKEKHIHRLGRKTGHYVIKTGR